MAPDTILSPGDVVQLSRRCNNREMAGQLLVVDRPTHYGVRGLVQVDGELCAYRAEWDEIEYVGQARMVEAA